VNVGQSLGALIALISFPIRRRCHCVISLHLPICGKGSRGSSFGTLTRPPMQRLIARAGAENESTGRAIVFRSVIVIQIKP